MSTFRNDDDTLRAGAEEVLKERRRLGLEGLVGGLEAVSIRVEPGDLVPAAREFLERTGHALADAFDQAGERCCLLRLPGSADVILRAGPLRDNPFRSYNYGPKSGHLPDTRLETFIFRCGDVRRYAAIQKERGVAFLTPEPLETSAFLFIQTRPSAYTGNSIGLVQWKGTPGRYRGDGCADLDLPLEKPDKAHLKDILELDHTATRVHARDRDPAILEFMGLTGYHFDFAVHVESLNSITNVARMPGGGFAMVFTSGIEPYSEDGSSGPTEQYIHNYGRRVHHMAFHCRDIRPVFSALKADGMEFLSELVGSPGEGLRQTFSRPSKRTLLVNEYIERYDGFDGFFTKSNVTLLTKATENQ
ncbi:hypothetical protein M7784_03140 [Desulfovibrio aminophilus]|nr:hypothetical protein [Desulfovibrio aminophilus]MCM0754240.1 hypothetical protein [Desulfovibrio aminophilus]